MATTVKVNNMSICYNGNPNINVNSIINYQNVINTVVLGKDH